MEIIKGKEKEYKKWYEKNKNDFYGSGIFTFAERWANLMESGISYGKKLEEIAKDSSHRADEEGITGFMYGAAVQILSDVWIYGEELRKWHNLDTQIENEGEEANKTGDVLNPATLIFH